MPKGNACCFFEHLVSSNFGFAHVETCTELYCPFDISVGVGAFVIGLSQISSFFSMYIIEIKKYKM